LQEDRRFIEETFPVKEVGIESAREKDIRYGHISTLHIWWARKEILKAYGGRPPKVLDPFGGGGAIPLEALRLGCETYSNDYNPAAVLIQKDLSEEQIKMIKTKQDEKIQVVQQCSSLT